MEKKKRCIKSNFTKSKDICFDFDGTITKWKGPGTKKELKNYPYKVNPPREKIVSLIRHLKRKGYRILIYSSRFDLDWQRSHHWYNDLYAFEFMDINIKLISEYMKKYCIPFDCICFKKPGACLYFDDQTINPLQFSLKEIKEFIDCLSI